MWLFDVWPKICVSIATTEMDFQHIYIWYRYNWIIFILFYSSTNIQNYVESIGPLDTLHWRLLLTSSFHLIVFSRHGFFGGIIVIFFFKYFKRFGTGHHTKKTCCKDQNPPQRIQKILGSKQLCYLWSASLAPVDLSRTIQWVKLAWSTWKRSDHFFCALLDSRAYWGASLLLQSSWGLFFTRLVNEIAQSLGFNLKVVLIHIWQDGGITRTPNKGTIPT